MHMIRTLAIALALFPLTAMAANAPVDFLGVVMGAPLSLPECERWKHNAAWYPKVDQITSAPCWKHKIGVDAGTPIDQAKNGKVDIVLPPSARPAGIRADGIDALIVAGKVESITAITTGNASQRELNALLELKYGPARFSKTESMQNAMGATFDAVKSYWKFDNLFVGFTGMNGRIDSGAITIWTPTGRSRMSEISAERKAEAVGF